MRGANVVGVGTTDIEIRDGKVVAVGRVGTAPIVDARGKWLVPAFIDSHVHLAFYPVADELARGGVAGAVDLAAPEAALADHDGPIQILRSGPMITAVRGYPTQSWGRDGYGIECANPRCAARAADRLIAAGAHVLKVPITDPTSPELLATVVERASSANIPVAVHALADADAMNARAAQVLAHTPLEPLSDATIAAWSDKTVVSTLSAFGAPTAVANLVRLRRAGTRVLYGTDLGNARELGISRSELELLMAAGLDGAAIIRAGTSDPARFWGFEDLGSIAVGKRASFLVVASDPLKNPLVLASPDLVFIDGKRLR